MLYTIIPKERIYRQYPSNGMESDTIAGGSTNQNGSSDAMIAMEQILLKQMREYLKDEQTFSVD